MSYLALARKWRPTTFDDLVGQSHVVRALVNALDSDRVHHAYLFSGTRGVGKTTIARIFAKALNCEQGVGPAPCGKCTACTGIDEGRFVDLLEVDAASRTGVDDTRELLENVQYTPAAGRFKVYLIDEVHMLSKHSFNALLKTLEEPPPHVKFLLATTDPQQLPVTVLSRCLQFNLKRLPTHLIVERMAEICKAEKIKAQPAALKLIAQSAAGSMRDALSLLDQALAFGGGVIKDADVTEMLGSIDQQQLDSILNLLGEGDAAGLMRQLSDLHDLVPNYEAVLDRLAELLQQIAVVQLAGSDSLDEDADKELLTDLAERLSPESVQLFYQIALTGRRDLALAPDPRVGFEMTLLRMLSFQPAHGNAVAPPAPLTGGRARSRVKPAPAKPQRKKKQALPRNADWNAIVAALDLRGAVRQLAEQCAMIDRSPDRLVLGVSQEGSVMLTEQLRDRLTAVLREHEGAGLRVEFEVVEDAGDTLARTQQDKRAQRLQAARESIASDPQVKELVDLFGAEVEADSIRPLDDGAAQ